MAQPVKVKIEIEGKQLENFSEVKIWQSVFDHHRFEIVMPLWMLPDGDQYLLDESSKLCGKNVSFSFDPDHDFTYATANLKFDLVFKGIITSVKLHTHGNLTSYFVVGGHSPTIMMEDSVKRKIFHKKKLDEVASEVLSSYASNVVKKSISTSVPKLPYIVQYNETNFQFLTRLANEYGQWFYYDGAQIVMGQPAKKEVKFKIDGEQGFDVSLMLNPSKFEMSAYVYGQDEMFIADGTGSVSGLNQLGELALNKSDSVFTNKSELKADKAVFEQSHIIDRAKVKRSMNASNLVVLKGNGEVPNITVGNVIDVTGTIPALGGRDGGEQAFGKYIITEIQHVVDETGNYSNNFKAVPESYSFPPPNPDVQSPLAYPEAATVTNHNDPEKMGRVKVKFFWPGDPAVVETDWIRVGTFHAGGSDGIGMLFIPEVGSQVIVGYEQSHPEYPFVMTSVYPNYSSVRTAADKNEEKYIQTMAGNQIAINDKQGNNTIEITNVNNPDTAITLEFASPGVVTIKTKGKVDINADEAINLKSKQKLTIDAMDIQIKASNGISVEATGNAEIKAMQLKMEAQTTAGLKGTAMTKVEGALIDVKASGLTTIGGAMVKIN